MIGSLVVNWTKRTVPLTSCRILVIQVFFHMGHVKIPTVFDAGISKSAKNLRKSFRTEVFVWPVLRVELPTSTPGTLVFQAHPVFFFWRGTGWPKDVSSGCVLPLAGLMMSSGMKSYPSYEKWGWISNPRMGNPVLNQDEMEWSRDFEHCSCE